MLTELTYLPDLTTDEKPECPCTARGCTWSGGPGPRRGVYLVPGGGGVPDPGECTCDILFASKASSKYQGVKEFHMLARIGCYCNIMVFSPFKVKVTYYHPLNLWLIGATNGN